MLGLDERLRDLLALVEEQDGLLASPPVLLQGLHEQPPLVDDGPRRFRLAERAADFLGLRLGRRLRELAQQLFRDVFVLLEAFLPETAEVEFQHGRGLVLPDVTGDALERERRFARPLEALDGDRPRRIGDEGAPDDLQLAAAPVERLAGDGVGVLVRAVGHRDCAGAGRGAGRFRRSTLELGGWSL